MDPEVIAALDSAIGRAMVAALAGVDALAARSELTRRFHTSDPELMRAAAAQAALVERATARFGSLAPEILWTGDGLEQASRPSASRHRARRLLDVGVASVADLTTGVGLDALAMAEAGLHVTAVEQDPHTAAAAAANARRLVPDRMRVVQGSCLDASLLARVGRRDAWFIDPSRRAGERSPHGRHRRLDDPDAWQPPWSWIVTQASLLGTASGASEGSQPWLLMAKAAPGLPHESIESAPEATVGAEWVSESGTLLECTVCWIAEGRVEPPPARSAVILDPTGAVLVRIDSGAAPMRPAVAPPAVGGYLHDPDPAVVRSGLVVDLATAAQTAAAPVALVDPKLAYLTSPLPLPDGYAAAARSWRVLSAGPYRPQQLRAECARHGIGRIDVTGRGRSLDPARVRRDLRLPGGGRQGTLVVLGLGEARRTTVCLGLAA
ncbi:MAG: class I SAM-dependent methyltransferase [Actinobacteria bacterium]|nr:class I SAM-dependent methyltransferase [Actinomycetota bacterium]MCB9412044.1 class I SAM-dependent methyltransferase [Actinomycetota bacterium]